MKIGIINVTGYAGIELARILYRHPEAEVVSVTGRSQAGEELGDALPHLSRMDITIEPEITRSVDVVFSALPQVASAEACVPFARDGVKVVDISADFRLHDPDEYARWYGAEHPAPDLLETSVYGLTELDRDGIASAQLVANPGCYPTAALLALAPVVEKGLIGEQDRRRLQVRRVRRGPRPEHDDALLGGERERLRVLGRRAPPPAGDHAGAAPDQGRLHAARALPAAPHPHDARHPRHRLRRLRGRRVRLGGGGVGLGDFELYREYYRDEPFVKVTDKPPQTKQTWGNNDCLVYPTVDRHTGKLVVFSALDNLVKGAAGQAVQNMNLMFGLPEATGLEQLAIYP